MRTPMPGRLLLTGAVIVAFASGLAACGGDDASSAGGHAGHGSASAMTTPGATADAKTATAAFIRQMIPHHEMAVDMAGDVVDAGEHPEIRSLAADVIETQTKEIAQLKEIANVEAIDISDPGAAEAADAKALGLAQSAMGMSMGGHSLDGKDPLDLAFIDAMIPHHDGALAMAAAVLNAGATGQVESLANEIVKAQSAEIAEMQRWRKQWYPDAPDATTDGAHDMGDHDAHDMQ